MKSTTAGWILAGLPLIASAQSPATDPDSMAKRQQQLEQQVREQEARIAELERLLKEKLGVDVSPGAGQGAVAPIPSPSTVPGSTIPAGAPGTAPGAGATVAPADAVVGKTESTRPEYTPNVGFRIYEGEKGEINMRLFSYARYLNQMGLDPTYTNYFGQEIAVDRRNDIQLNKFFLPFSGWFLDEKWRYYLYVWSSNPSQGDPAQVVGAGNLSYVASPHLTIGAGITSLPSVRSTEGQFPFWLTVDNRLLADEFFRGSYTSGIWAKGQIVPGVNYMAMLGNNLSTLGVSASQLDDKLATWSVMLNWMPTTHEFGPWGAFGDFEGHEDLATRYGVHFTDSVEDAQEQPGTNGIENTQIRLTDGSVIFTRNLFGPGINVDEVHYQMASIDAGFKYQGYSLEGEVYWRKLSDFVGPGTQIIGDIEDHGFQLQASAMLIPQLLQLYAGTSGIYGHYGDASEVRAGINYFPQRQRGIRLNGEWINLDNSPVGYTAVPYPVGGNGNLFHLNFELNF